MGTFSANIAIGSPDGSRFEAVNAFVDTGSSLTAIPASILHRLGVTPHRKNIFELADSREIERDVGRAWLRIGQQSEITLVMFADAETEPLLGAISLQGSVSFCWVVSGVAVLKQYDRPNPTQQNATEPRH